MDTIGQFEFFGDEEQIRLQQRYYRLWQYLKVHQRLSFVGRAIGLDAPGLDDVEPLAGLAKELGFLSLAFTTPADVDALCEALEARDLETGRWQHLLSDEHTLSKCRALLADGDFPSDCGIDRITDVTPTGFVRDFQELMHRCGVAPLPGYILRGRDLPTVAEAVLSSRKQVLAVGGGIFRHNPKGPYGKWAHVGFLATDRDHRGQGLARLLLARIIVACYEEYGAETVHTGVRSQNVPSQIVCRACGLQNSGMYFVAVAYPPLLGGAQFTR